jgi:predicted nucleic acid-binding protein
LTHLAERLRAHRRVAIDSNIFIYLLNEDPPYVDLAQDVFAWIERPTHSAVTSTVTLTELLVRPYRMGDRQQIAHIYSLLTIYPNLEWIAPTLDVADTAARIRAVAGLRTPDALQAATALHSKATALITNDAAFERVREFETITLNAFL